MMSQIASMEIIEKTRISAERIYAMDFLTLDEVVFAMINMF